MVGTQCRGIRGHRGALIAAVFSIATKAAAQDAPASLPAKQEGNGEASPPREQLGSQRQLVLSIEGLLAIRAVLPITSRDTFEDGTTLEGYFTSTRVEAFSPNVAVDGFLWKHLSIGLAAGFGGESSRSDAKLISSSGTESHQNSNSSAGIFLAPRLGVAFTDASGLGVWARGGLEAYLSSSTYQHEGPEGSDLRTQSDTSFGVRGEVLGTYSPVAHLVFMAGPYLRAQIDERPAWPTLGLNINAGMFF